MAQFRSFSHGGRAGRPVDALNYEIAQEMAGALGRMGRLLEASLRALTEFDATRPHRELTPSAVDARRQLVGEAARALWLLVVQREACGLRDSPQLMRDYGVPREVRDRMGVFP
jgi:hypothetical protein